MQGNEGKGRLQIENPQCEGDIFLSPAKLSYSSHAGFGQRQGDNGY
jgi:hypothetical protein